MVAVRRLWQQELVFLAFWASVVLFWGLRFYQSRDAEVLLLLFAIWPDAWPMVAGICLTTTLMIGSIPWWRYLWTWWRARLRTGVWLPSSAELAEGEPITFLFSAVGIAYVGVRPCG